MIVPPFISLFCVIGFKNVRLGGGVIPMFLHVFRCCKCSEMPYCRGFSCFYTLLYIYMCARNLLCVRWVSDHAHESDDCAHAAYIVAREKERLVYGVVFGDA